LKNIGPDDGYESAADDVNEHDCKANDRANIVVPAQKSFECRADGIDLSADVNRHKHDQREGCDQPNAMARIAQSRFQVIGNCDRIVTIGQPFESPAQKDPSGGDTEDFAEDYPQGLRADGCTHTGQSNQKPSRLAGRAR